MFSLDKNKKLIGALGFAFLLNLLMVFRKTGIDELSSVFLSQLPFWDLVAHEKGSSILYFFLVSLSPFEPLLSARFLSIVFALSSVFVFYLIVRNIVEEKTAFLSVLLLAFNPLFFLFSHHARAYSLFVFLFLLSIYFLQKKDFPKLLLANILLIPSHLVSFIYLPLQSFFLLRKKPNLKETFLIFISLLSLGLYFLYFILPYFSELPLNNSASIFSILYLFYKFFALPNISSLGLLFVPVFLFVLYLYYLILKKHFVSSFFQKILFFIPKKEDLLSKFSLAFLFLHLIAGLFFPTLLYFRYFVYFLPFLSFSLAKAITNKPKLFYLVLAYFFLNIVCYAYISYSLDNWSLIIGH